MKKYYLLLISLILLVSGCDSPRDSVKDSVKTQVSVPFLTYYKESSNKVTAKLSYWDANNGRITFTDQLVYTAIPTEKNNRVEPIIWDGNKKIILHKTSYSDGEFKEKAEIIKMYTMNTIYGRNIQAKRNLDDNADPVKKKVVDYTLYLNDENGIIEKKLAFLLKTKDDKNNYIVVGEDDIPSYVDYNKKTGEITFIFKYFFETHTSIYVARCNVHNIEKINWDEIRLSKAIKTGGNYTPYPNNSALIGSKYYIQSFLNLAEVDLEKKESKTLDNINKECRSIVKEGVFEPDFPKDIIPVGVYEDVLILNVPVSTDTNLEYLMCAYKNNEFLGAIHLKSDDTWNVINSDKKVVSVINMRDKSLFKMWGVHYLYFPFLGNVM